MKDHKANKLRRTQVIVIGLFVCLMAFLACTSDDTCTQVDRVKVKIGFYIKINGVEKDTTLQVFSADGIVENDTNLYDSVNTGKIEILLSQLDDMCSYRFTLNDVDTTFVPDTVVLTDSIIGYEPNGDTLFAHRIDTTPVYDTTYWDDVITFEYERKLNFISEACGFEYYFNIVNVFSTHVSIDTVEIVSPKIDDEPDEENLKIYFYSAADSIRK